MPVRLRMTSESDCRSARYSSFDVYLLQLILPMEFFFVQDFRKKYRYFSSEPLTEIKVEFSRLRKFWETAKKKLMLLPLKTLKQEQAFERTLKIQDDQIRILHSGRLDEKKMRSKFYFFLQRQRTKHIFILAGESLILPISGIAAFLPGPNVFFYALALFMIVQWQALRGINRLLKKDHLFIPDVSLKEWEDILSDRDDAIFLPLLEKIGERHNVQDIKKILWK